MQHNRNRKTYSLCRVTAFLLSLCIIFTACTPLSNNAPNAPNASNASNASGEYNFSNKSNVYRTEEKFSQIVYTRPDLDAILDKANQAIKSAGTGLLPLNLMQSMSELSELTQTFYTEQTIAMIRNSADTTDKYYRDEMAFLDNASDQIQAQYDILYESILSSRFGKLFESMLGPSELEEYKLSSEITSHQILELQEEESRLCAEYTYEFSQGTVFFDGKEQQYSSLSPEDKYSAWPVFIKKYNPVFGEIFIKLVKVRDEMAKKLGFSDYTQVADRKMMRTCYDRTDIRKFREVLKKNLAPLYSSYQKSFYDRAKKASMNKTVYLFDAPDPKPFGTWENTIGSMQDLFIEMSDETADCFDYMLNHEFINVTPSANKANVSFTTSIYDMNTPYLFANFDQTSHDVLTFTHEFGHAFASYQQQKLGSLTEGKTMDICEIHSQAMQVLTLPKLELFYGDEADTARKYTIYTLISGILSSAADDEFQETIYRHPEMTVPEINKLYKRLLLDYGLSIESDYSDLDTQSMQWFTVNQYYEVPFYSIDYALSGCVALEFLELINKDYDKALETYFKLISQSSDDDFLTVLENTGLQSPLNSLNIENILAVIKSNLDNII